MNWDSIKYIFQLPLSWFKKIHNRVFNAYGTNFLVVREGFYGGTEIGIDSDGFSDAVKKSGSFVTLDTQQEISATKTFVENAAIVVTDSGYISVLDMDTNSQTYIGKGTVRLEKYDGSAMITLRAKSSSDSYITKSGNGGATTINDPNGIVLDTVANEAKLANQPTDTSTSSTAIATVGYCQSIFGKVKSVNGQYPDANGAVTLNLPRGTVQSVDGITPDSATGNVQLNAIRTINGVAGTNGNFAGVVTSVNGETPTNGEVDLDVVYTVNETAPDANGNVDVGTVRAVDGHSPDAQGAVSFGLTANKWLKSDAAGHITTTNDTVISVPSGTTPATGYVDVVAGVTWDGTQLVIAHKRMNFTNGVYTGTTNLSNTTISTVAYT